jgi:hypothetical protein
VPNPLQGISLLRLSDGHIYEVDPTSISTSPSHTITLESATYDDVSVHQPDSICLSGDILIVTTQYGSIFKYQYSTGTLLESRSLWRCISNASNNTNGCSLIAGKAVNDILPIWDNGLLNPTLSLWDISATPMVCVGSLSYPINNNSSSYQINAAGIDSTTKTLWVVWANGKLTIYDIKKAFASTAKTKISSSGSAVSGTILRLPLHTNGACNLEYNSSISAAEATIATRFSDTDYLEIALTGSGGTEKADARLFHS